MPLTINYKYIIVFLLISFLAIVVYTPAINAPFAIEDEYEFLEIANGKKNYKTGEVKEVSFIDFQNKFILLGRYAPFSMGVKYLKAKYFPLNAKANHLILIAIAILSSFLLFIIFRKFEIDILLSFMGALLYLFGPFATINIRLSTGESPGNLMLFMTIILIMSFIRGRKPITSVFIFITSLFMSQCKESYTLLLPVLAAVYVFYYSYLHKSNIFETIKSQYKQLIALFLVPFLIGVVGIINAINARGEVFAYGGTNSHFMLLISNFIWLTKWLIPLVTFILFAAFLAFKKKEIKLLSLPIAITFIWLSSQLVSYYNIKISSSQVRFLVPGCLIVLFYAIIAIDYIKAQKKIVYYFALAVMSLLLIKNIKLAYIDAGVFYANAKAFNKMMDYIADKKIESIAFYQGYEIVNASFNQLNHRGYIPKIFASTTKLEREDNKDFNLKLLETLKNTYGQLEFDDMMLNKRTPQMLIVSLPLPDNKQVPDQLVSSSFSTKKLFTQTFTNVKFSDLMHTAFYKGDLKNDSISFVTYIR
jgi:hypothetical protein